MTAIFGTDPRTGIDLSPVTDETTPEQVAAIVGAAHDAAAAFAALGRGGRAKILDAIAVSIEAHRAELVDIAIAETGFARAKLDGELTRAAFQCRFFADVIREGSYLEATIDPAGDTPMGPRPDLRRILAPIGAVAVFGASNFPFAFSVLGGDTASALAAGNPVVLKAHGSHPGTSQLSFDILRSALREQHFVADAIGIVFGLQAGAALVADPRIKAVGFTGSLAGGQALLSIINQRPEPIPFYGELSSINPVVVTPAAAAARGQQIGAGLVASFTVGSGQLCTKPGVVLIPEGKGGDDLLEAATAALGESTGHVLLNRGIYDSYVRATDLLADRPEGRTVTAPTNSDDGFAVTPQLFEISLEQLDPALLHEVFGPVTMIVRYQPDAVLSSAATLFDMLPASLTATMQIADDDEEVEALTQLAAEHAGRVVFNGFPTGVAVSWAQTHGGPWPSTNSLHTSVGATAIRRFLRPITYQDAPAQVLPAELRDDAIDVPRRIDGRLVLPQA